MDHLKEAKSFVLAAGRVGVTAEWSQAHALTSVAHMLIAFYERIDKAAAEKAVEDKAFFSTGGKRN